MHLFRFPFFYQFHFKRFYSVFKTRIFFKGISEAASTLALNLCRCQTCLKGAFFRIKDFPYHCVSPSSSFFALQTSGGPELVTWSNLLSLGNKSAAASEAANAIGDQGIINMEDDDSDDEDFSDHEIQIPGGVTTSATNANSTLSSIFNSFNSNSPQSVISASATNENQGSKPFEILRDLWCHHAHLAVFMNFVISQDDPSALVSSLINFALITLLLTFRVNHVLLEHYLN